MEARKAVRQEHRTPFVPCHIQQLAQTRNMPPESPGVQQINAAREKEELNALVSALKDPQAEEPVARVVLM